MSEDDHVYLKKREQGSGWKESLLTFGTGLGVLGIGIGVKANDPELMKMLVTQAPGIAASLLMTIFFLKHINTSKKDDRQATAQLIQATHDIHIQCHEIQQRSLLAVDRNTEMMGKALATIARLEKRKSASRSAEDE